VALLETPFLWEMLSLFWARECASSILRGVQRYEAKFSSQHAQNPVGLCFLNSKKTGESSRSDVFLT